jgi:hypothetical protein
MQKVLIFCVLSLLVVQSQAQKEANVWHFGTRAGLDFNGGAPAVAFGSTMAQFEGVASIADRSTGQLLFYTSGITVYDANHDTMPNGKNLFGNPSSTQSSIIVPKPGAPDNYYIFTVDDIAGPDGLRYSEVDMTLNSGMGDVIPGQKNILLHTPVAEKICAVKHKNGQGYWVVAHGISDSFLAYHVTTAGISTTPVASKIGSNHGTPLFASIGQMKISPDGKRIACAAYGKHSIQVFDFDNATGIVSNEITLGSWTFEYGVEFSPDASTAIMPVNMVLFN